MTSPPISFLNNHLLILAAPHEQQQKRGRDEEDDVHDAEREAGLEHGARLVHIEPEAAITAKAAGVQRDGEGARRGKVRTVGLGDGAQFEDTRDQGTGKAEVDEGDEEGGAPG